MIESRGWTCPICGDNFAYASSFMMHLREQHGTYSRDFIENGLGEWGEGAEETLGRLRKRGVFDETILSLWLSTNL